MSGRRRRAVAVPQRRRIQNQGICPLETCGKVRYASRADARKAAHLLFPGDHLTAYQCDDFWHFGHEPLRVIQGKGWDKVDPVERAAAKLHAEMADLTATDETPPLECEGCGVEVTWVPDIGYAHTCEVIGVEDESEEPG